MRPCGKHARSRHPMRTKTNTFAVRELASRDRPRSALAHVLLKPAPFTLEGFVSLRCEAPPIPSGEILRIVDPMARMVREMRMARRIPVVAVVVAGAVEIGVVIAAITGGLRIGSHVGIGVRPFLGRLFRLN